MNIRLKFICFICLYISIANAEVKVIKVGKGKNFFLTHPAMSDDQIKGTLSNTSTKKIRGKRFTHTNKVSYKASIMSLLDEKKSTVQLQSISLSGPVKKSISKSDLQALENPMYTLHLTQDSDKKLHIPVGFSFSEAQQNILDIFNESLYNLIIPLPTQKVNQGSQ